MGMGLNLCRDQERLYGFGMGGYGDGCVGWNGMG